MGSEGAKLFSVLPIEKEAPVRPRDLEVLNEIARIATLDLELRPMLQRITDTMQDQFGWPFVALAIVDFEQEVFVCEALSTSLPSAVNVGYTRRLGTGIVGEVALRGEPILLDDVGHSSNYVETMPGARSELCVPVRHTGRTVAILNLESTEPHAFHDQLPLLQTVAEQIAGAIACARLYQEVQRRARLLEMVSEVSRTALEAGELRPLLDRVVHYVQLQFSLSAVSILLVDPQRTQFELASRAGELELSLDARTRWPLREGVVGRSLRLGKAQFVPDVHKDPDYIPLHEEVISELVIPIRFRNRTLGVFDLESTTPESFSVENQVVFQTFADQLAGAIHMASINQQLEEANRRLQQLSSIDGLTGIANRRQLDETLENEWRRAFRHDSPLSIVMFDLDEFKRFNDSYGHQAGDECLRQVATALREGLHRAGDLVARYGGEEFAAVLPDSDLRGAVQYAESARLAVEELAITHTSSPVSSVVTMSAGVASALPRRGGSPAELIAHADRALYQAKRKGKNRVEDSE
ncbi:MAG TPA: diguanylate cyclase [Thermoanaerobaculia bacterium]|nr:diguanylate cyclase [Thermoanaerobaculia bacterium]